MSQGTLTVNDAFELIKDRIKNINDLSEDRKLRLGNIMDEEVYNSIAENSPAQLTLTQVYTISSQPQIITLPIDLLSWQHDDQGFFVLSDTGEDTGEKLTISNRGGTRGFIQEDETTVKILSFTGSLNLRYLPERTDLVALTDTLVAPNGNMFREVVRAGMFEQYYLQKREDFEESRFRADFRAILDDFVMRQRKTSAVAPVLDISPSY